MASSRWRRAWHVALSLLVASAGAGYLAFCAGQLDDESRFEEVLPAMAAGQWHLPPGSSGAATLTLEPQGGVGYDDLTEASWSFRGGRLEYIDPTPYPDRPGDPPYDPSLDIHDSYWRFTGTLSITDDSSGFYLTAPVTVTLSATSTAAPRRMKVDTTEVRSLGFPAEWVSRD